MNQTSFSSIAIAILLAPICPSAFGQGLELKSGDWMLRVTVGQPIQISNGSEPSARVADPLASDLIDRAGNITHVTGRYTAVHADNGQITATGAINCPSGSALDFTDLFTAVADRGSFSLSRTVTVSKSADTDAGFRTEFGVQSVHANRLDDVQPFIPGIWYCDNSHVPPSGMISDPNQRDYLFREDRLPIPMSMFREKSSGLSISIVHDQPDGATFTGENTSHTVIDSRMKFASVGLRQQDGMAVVLAYPGAEGDQSHVGGPVRHQRSERFHPLQVGFSQNYQLVIHLAKSSTFDDAMRDSWRMGFDTLMPAVIKLPMDRIYASSIDVLDHYGAEHHGVIGFPFAVTLPDGVVRDVSYQMGFVGEQLPCAGHLITAGFARSNDDLIRKGEQIVDFWATDTLTPAGIPRTWYDVDPKPHWRDYKTFTRIATDGMEGMLQAWRRMKVNHRDKPAWLACCRTYGDWLVANQNSDGSFCRQYDFDGKVLISSKSATLHPVRFLIDLGYATGDRRYLESARRAGSFGIKDIGTNTNYYGGTADNNDVKDKEAGWIALDSFLSLYEATNDRNWLTAAVKAATFTESWVYCWNVPIPRDDPKATVPDIKTTAGISLIATGHSGADVFLAFGPYAYYRLSIYTNDPHDAVIARLLLYNTRQLVDDAGSLHYARPGLLTEAFTLATPHGHGVGVWLPWCTAAVLDPMQQLQDTFGSMDLDEIDKLPMQKRGTMLKAFAQSHGFPRPDQAVR